jgi:putative thioredoxin
MFGLNKPAGGDTHEMKDFSKEVIEASQHQPVLVDFWAPWCGPCRMLGPVLESLTEKRDDVVLVKINTDNNQELAMEYGIRGIPAVKLFHRGRVVGDFTGALPAFYVQKWLDEQLAGLSAADAEA